MKVQTFSCELSGRIIPLMMRVVMFNAEALEWCVIQQLRSVFKRTVRFMRCIMELASGVIFNTHLPVLIFVVDQLVGIFFLLPLSEHLKFEFCFILNSIKVGNNDGSPPKRFYMHTTS